MKKMCLFGAAMVSVGSLWACTGMYVGKRVSEDGTALLGRTVDTAPWTSAHMYVVNPRVENVSNRICRSWMNGFRWELPATTWKFVSTPRLRTLGRGRMDSACANEKGVAITGTVTGFTEGKILALDPFVKDVGAGEDSLPGLLAQCCSTARDCVELLGKVVAKAGHNGPEIYMFADKDEAWYVEVYSGHEWAAVRMPEDKVACWGNQFMIRSFDPSAENTRCSPGLIAVPERAGLLVKGADGLSDLCRTYAQELRDYSNYRIWFGHRALAPATAGEYAIDRPMELFFAPGRKIGYRDLFELMRTRYEGTDHNPEANHLQGVRTIGTTKQATSHVLSIDSRLPAEFRCTIWASLGNCEHTVFMPLNAAIGRTDREYAIDQLTGPFRYDDQIASMAFRRLAALAEKERYWYGKGLRDFWRKREDWYLERYPKLLKAPDAAKLTEWTVAAQREDLANARRIFDELSWYVTENNRITGDGSGATFEPSRPFVPLSYPKRKTQVLFFFDTEDFTDDRSNDAIRDIANILKDEGVRGNFAMVCELGNFIVEKGRKDVIEALSHHLMGSQTFYHSKYPTINELGDISDFDRAYKLTMEIEKRGFDLLREKLGAKRVWCSVFPGPSNSYVGLYVHSALGAPFFGGGNASFTAAERQAVWYVNQFHLPYYKSLHLESFIPPQPPIDLAVKLNELATNDIVTLYMHPHMALNQRHWDGVNLKPGEEAEWGKWRKAPPRRDVDIAVYYDRLRALVHALANDPRFEMTDCERLHRSFKPRKDITAADLPAIRDSLRRRLGPVEEPGSWCVADVFQATVKLLGGERSFMPGYVWGFLEPPKGVPEKTGVSAAELRTAAKSIDLNRFIPSEIQVGAAKLGPADFLFAALEVLISGADRVTVEPRADQLGPLAELMPSLATCSTVGQWGIYHKEYQDTYMTPRLRLQLWTLRYEDGRN